MSHDVKLKVKELEDLITKESKIGVTYVLDREKLLFDIKEDENKNISKDELSNDFVNSCENAFTKIFTSYNIKINEDDEVLMSKIDHNDLIELILMPSTGKGE